MKAETRFNVIINERGLKKTWVAEKLGVCPGHLTNMLCGKSTLTEKHKATLNDLLKTDIK
jgi:plasmid maintenance system antidote protein VapI